MREAEDSGDKDDNRVGHGAIYCDRKLKGVAYGGAKESIKLQFGEVKSEMPKGSPREEIKPTVGCMSLELRRETDDPVWVSPAH